MEVSIKSGPHLYFETHGTRGPHLLLVHGLMSSRAQWLLNLKELSRFCRPVIVELFGHGRSPSPKNTEDYLPENYVREFELIRHQVGAEKWFICGQSLGAALTLRYSLLHPKRITAQIFTNSMSALSVARENENTEKTVRAMFPEGKASLDRFPLNPAHSRFLNPEVKKALVADIDLIDLEGFAHTLLHLLPKCSVRNLLHDIKVPTLLVAGKFDKRFTPLVPVALHLIPALEFIELDGGHAVNIDAAAQFNKALCEFITHYDNGNKLA